MCSYLVYSTSKLKIYNLPIRAFIYSRYHIIPMGRRGRTRCPRIVGDIPAVDYLKPRGIPLRDLKVARL
ncbi:MAG: hypothetical protein KAU03_07045, partial [Candidatus Altiarchaeales archaeon]|nr:hypothetical protein [Candidatus Altiarchaeales archaeon]